MPPLLRVLLVTAHKMIVIVEPLSTGGRMLDYNRSRMVALNQPKIWSEV